MAMFDESPAEYDYPATPMEAMREYARNVGADRPNFAWILTDYDVYVRNPYFTGPRCETLTDPESRDEMYYIMHDGCHGDVCHAESFDVPRNLKSWLTITADDCEDGAIPF
jgi:hypothetical protein